MRGPRTADCRSACVSGSRITARPPPRNRGCTKLIGSAEITVGWAGFLPSEVEHQLVGEPHQKLAARC